jgi:hypothetical protein
MRNPRQSLLADLPALLEWMDEGAVSRSCAFPFQTPRGAGYGAANADVLAAAEASAGRVTAFCRSEPGEQFEAELTHALDAGARGIKLHTSLPGFDFAHPGLAVAFALAQERSVPLLFHTGRAVPPLARDLAALLERHPGAQVVLAGGVVSLQLRRFVKQPLDCTSDTALAASFRPRAILCEKPMATCLAEADAMIDFCKASNVTLVIGHQRRFYPRYNMSSLLRSQQSLGGKLLSAPHRSWSQIWGIR